MPGCVRRVQGYFGKRLQLLTVYGHPPPGSRWDMRTSYSHTLDLLSRGRAAAPICRTYSSLGSVIEKRLRPLCAGCLAGKLEIGSLITHRFKAKQLEECYQRLDGGEQDIVGAVFSWD